MAICTGFISVWITSVRSRQARVGFPRQSAPSCPATGFDTIPTCALDAYGCSLVHVVRHKDCPRRFKGDRVASMLHLHRRLRDDNSVPGLDAVLVRGIRHWATDSDVEEILQHLAPEQFGGLSEEVALLTAALRPTRAGG